MANAVRTISLLSLYTLALIGCASVPQQSFNAKENAHLKRIAILTVPQPQSVTIRNFGSPAALIGGGLGAGIATAASASANADPLARLLMTERFDFSVEMRDALARELNRSGYQVSFADAPRNDPVKLLTNYQPYAGPDKDAVLDVALGTFYFGYSNVNLFDNQYRPHLDVRFHLVDPRTGTTLYAERFIYGYSNPFMGGTQIPAPKDYHFADSETVLKEGKRTVAGLRAGIATLASRIGEQLRR